MKIKVIGEFEIKVEKKYNSKIIFNDMKKAIIGRTIMSTNDEETYEIKRLNLEELK